MLRPKFIYTCTNNTINLTSDSKYDFEKSSNKSKYHNILGNRKSIMKIQDYIYTSNLNKIITNYKVINQMKTIQFKTNKKLFTKGKLEINNEEKYNEGTTLMENGSIPSLGFWNQRYYYFTKYDEGINLDYESIKNFNFLGWYSVTPEEISIYIAEFCRNKTVLDAFGGCGGNTIQFSQMCSQIYYNEIDEKKVNFCKNNCKVYECPENVIFLNFDYLELKDKLKVNIFYIKIIFFKKKVLSLKIKIIF